MYLYGISLIPLCQKMHTAITLITLRSSGTFVVGMCNVRSGRNGGLESALRGLGLMNVDSAGLTETKLTDGFYA